MNPEQFNFLVNSGVAGLFAVFALVLFDKFIKFLEHQTEQWQSFLKEQRESYNLAIKDQRDAFSSGMSRIADEVKMTAIAVQTNRIVLEHVENTLIEHDERIKDAIPEMRKALPGQKEKSRPLRGGG